MILYLKRDTSNIDIPFIIYDDKYVEKYYVVRDYTRSYWSMAITDVHLNKLSEITTIPLPILKAFTIKNKKDTIRLIFNKNKLRPMCYYYGISWRISGDIINKNYEIIDTDNSLMMQHNKTWDYKNSGYKINIKDESRELFLLASAVCVDLTETAQSKQLQTV